MRISLTRTGMRPTGADFMVQALASSSSFTSVLFDDDGSNSETAG